MAVSTIVYVCLTFSRSLNKFLSLANRSTDDEQKMVKRRANPSKHLGKRLSSSTWHPALSRKRTGEGGAKKRDNDLHRLLFKPNGLPDGAKLAYYAKGQISPSQFEAHAGWAARRQPYRHIYTSNGLTLHDVAMSLARGQNLTTGSNDDMCTICGDRGELIPCGGCPRAYHQRIPHLGIKKFQNQAKRKMMEKMEEDKCKACAEEEEELPSSSSSSSSVIRWPWKEKGLRLKHHVPDSDWCCSNCNDRKEDMKDSSNNCKPIIIRLTRVVKTSETESGGCVLCRENDFSVEKFDDRTVIICDQCEKEYHVGCLRVGGRCDLKELPKDKWFCCNDCERIHCALRDLVLKGSETISSSESMNISRKLLDKGLSSLADNELNWHILSGKCRRHEHLPLLSKAVSIFRGKMDDHYCIGLECRLAIENNQKIPG
ncbi:hypothetical protein Cgig2_022537 [Carnegiea gigantea]|uniref:PHD-type domain-containing protein n=1 Tax=Carnegiea gigantea TaxID=171969 RepID=A0A9Q1JNP1_9CARY|nr:hypothetical protein Cgig2_022537 [Carnegiea gigantea]